MTYLQHHLRYISCGVGLLSGVNAAGGSNNVLDEIIELAGVQCGAIPAGITSSQNKSPGAFFVGSSTVGATARNLFENLAPLGELYESPPALNTNSHNHIVVWVFRPDTEKCRLYHKAMSKLNRADWVFPEKFFSEGYTPPAPKAAPSRDIAL
jgi:hypothetical protein